METVLFFFFLTTSLFLGDGKQPFVDVWWALGILMMYGIRYYQRGALGLRPPPRPIGFAWAALILYSIILTPFSDSAGYSITATIRLIEGYLAYVMFATISSERTMALFAKGLLFVGAVATVSSFVFFLFPSLASLLPPMNLLYATYGHNHLADLLLLIFPISIAWLQHKQSPLSWFLLIFFTVGMLLTFARGAWILLVFYLLFLVVRSKDRIIRRVGLSVAAVTIAAFLFISLVSTRGVPQKPSFLQDGRWEYWRQAIEAIKERPTFGSGPGTFYLQSKRLQARPNSYSWFAHSFPLQIAVETGVVGLVIFLFLLWNVVRKSKPSPLLGGAILVLLYSLYEFTLDYTAMWLLAWAALGSLMKHDAQRRGHSKVTTGALTILALFYVLSVGSLAASVLGRKDLAFFLAPYDTNATKELLEKQKTNLPLITFFHRKNPEVLFAYHAGCEQLIPLDIKNENFQKECLKLLFANGDKKGGGVLLFLFGQDIVSKGAPWRLSLEDFTNQRFLESITYTMLDELLFSAQNKRYGFAKLVYSIGLKVVDKDPMLTRRLWLLARDTSPGWSYYHVELASLDAWVFGDVVSARRRLARCTELKDPRAHCLYILKNTIPPVGSQRANIEAIPNRP